MYLCQTVYKLLNYNCQNRLNIYNDSMILFIVKYELIYDIMELYINGIQTKYS